MAIRAMCKYFTLLTGTQLWVIQLRNQVVNLIVVMGLDKVVDCSQCWGNMCLCLHGILRCNCQDLELPFQNPKNPLNNILHRSMAKGEELLGIGWTV